jgi:hypothetical protein
MNTFDAVGIAEGFVQAESEEQVIEAWQYLIDTGLAWKLQGWFGRTASHLIGEGVCEKPNPNRPALDAIQSIYQEEK